MCLDFLFSILHKWKPVEIPLTTREEQPVIMYVDAYFEEDNNSLGEGHTSPPSKKYFGGLGALVIEDQGKYHAFACTIRADFWDSLAPRKNQILPAELITPLCVAHTALHLLKGRGVIIFGDNLGGVCCTIKGSSQEWDLQCIIGTYHHKFADLECAWWMVWPPSESNPADELSRGDASPFASPTVQLEFPDSLLPTGRFGDPF